MLRGRHERRRRAHSFKAASAQIVLRILKFRCIQRFRFRSNRESDARNFNAERSVVFGDTGRSEYRGIKNSVAERRRCVVYLRNYVATECTYARQAQAV